MRHKSYVLIGQAGWVTRLASGLQESGLPVLTAPIDTFRDAINPRMWLRLRSATVIVRVGFRPGAQTWRGRAFDGALNLFGSRAKTVCYWIGSDVMRLAEDQSLGIQVAGWRSAALGVDHHFAGSEPLQKELQACGVSSTVVGFPWRTVDVPDQLPPLPQQFTVLSYVPDARPEFYGGPVLLAVAQRFPDVRFEVMGGEGAWAQEVPNNVHFLGWVKNPEELFSRATCVVRLVEHDSIGGTAVEGLLFGRQVIYSQPLRYTHLVDFGPDALGQALADLVAKWEDGGLDVDASASNWARSEFNHVIRFDNLASRLREISASQRQLRLSYLTLQATTEGQAAHAHVHEIIKGLARGEWSVHLRQPNYASSSPRIATRLAQFVTAQCAILRELHRSDALYVRAHFAALPAALFAKAMGTPVVQEVNGPHEDAIIAWPSLRHVKRFISAGNRIQFREADAVITVTPQLVRWLNKDSGVANGRLVSNGADTDLFIPNSTRPHGLPERYVVFFGALAPWQGIEVALQAARSAEWPQDVALVIAGDGRMRDAVQSAADGVRIVYLGRRPYSEIPGIVSNSLASLLPKLADNHTESGLAPLKLFESMACGVPVVASNLPGMAETIQDANCGVLVEPGSAADLARAVQLISSAASKATAMGMRGHQNAVLNHSWQSRAEDTAKVLRSIMPISERQRNDVREFNDSRTL